MNQYTNAICAILTGFSIGAAMVSVRKERLILTAIFSTIAAFFFFLGAPIG